MNQTDYAKWQYKRALRVFRFLDDDRINQEYWSDRYDEMTMDIEDRYCHAAQRTWVKRNKKPIGGKAWWTWKRDQIAFARGKMPLTAKIDNHIQKHFVQS